MMDTQSNFEETFRRNTRSIVEKRVQNYPQFGKAETFRKKRRHICKINTIINFKEENLQFYRIIQITLEANIK
jgi:ribosomal protein L29